MKNMEGGSEKGFSPSKSTSSPRHSSTGSEENNENVPTQDQMIPKLQSTKKMVAKHFMSPTISAASKAAAPRMKVLGERNENSTTCDAPNQKMTNLDVKKGPIGQPDDSSAKAYDPVTNYLSPRPKYLRFNPNRRREVFNRLEKEGVELNRSLGSKEARDAEESQAAEIQYLFSSFPEEGIVKPKYDEDSEEDGEDISNGVEEGEEEEEEGEPEGERRWCLGGVLKLLLTLITCLLSSSYICSMNPPTPSPTLQGLRDPKDSYLMVQNQTLEVITKKLYDNNFLGVEVGHNHGDVEEVLIDEGDNGDSEMNFVEEMVEANEDILDEHDGEIVGNDNEESGAKMDTDEFQTENSEQLIGTKTDESVDNNEAEENEIVEGGEVEPETMRFGQLLGEETAESEDAGGYRLGEVPEGSNQLKEHPSVKSVSGEDTLQEESKESEVPEGSNQLKEHPSVKSVSGEDTLQEESKENDGSETDSGHEFDERGFDNEVEMEKLGRNVSALLGVSVGSVLLTSLAFIYLSKKARNTYAKESEAVMKPRKFAEEKKVTPVLPPVERKIEFLARPLLSNSAEEATRELNHHISPPTVELIGEIIVGQPSSLRSFDSKFHMAESKENNATSPLPVSASPIRPPTNSPSYERSFTAKRKVQKKEGGQRAEAMMEVTPVRRSSRLRNRAAVVSP